MPSCRGSFRTRGLRLLRLLSLDWDYLVDPTFQKMHAICPFLRCKKVDLNQALLWSGSGLGYQTVCRTDIKSW